MAARRQLVRGIQRIGPNFFFANDNFEALPFDSPAVTCIRFRYRWPKDVKMIEWSAWHTLRRCRLAYISGSSSFLQRACPLDALIELVRRLRDAAFVRGPAALSNDKETKRYGQSLFVQGSYAHRQALVAPAAAAAHARPAAARRGQRRRSAPSHLRDSVIPAAHHMHDVVDAHTRPPTFYNLYCKDIANIVHNTAVAARFLSTSDSEHSHMFHAYLESNLAPCWLAAHRPSVYQRSRCPR